MPSPFSSRATLWPEVKEPPGLATVEFSKNSVVQSPGSLAALPPFTLDMDNDPTPSGEDEAGAWIASMCSKPMEWLPKLVAVSQTADIGLVRSQFSKMYRIYADNDVGSFFETHFRRPETPAGTRPFPLRIEITAFLVCTGLALLGALLLILSR